MKYIYYGCYDGMPSEGIFIDEEHGQGTTGLEYDSKLSLGAVWVKDYGLRGGVG